MDGGWLTVVEGITRRQQGREKDKNDQQMARRGEAVDSTCSCNYYVSSVAASQVSGRSASRGSFQLTRQKQCTSPKKAKTTFEKC